MSAQPPWIRKFDEFQALTVAWKEEEFNPPPHTHTGQFLEYASALSYE